ncbi:MAG: hypothetical protein ACRD0K_27405 [Egibacteraceae bacterium]
MRGLELRRWLTAGVLLAVTLIALLGSRAVDLPVLAHGCEDWVCAGDPTSFPAGDHSFPAHDPCLHDHACGGGGALGLGGVLLAVAAAWVLTMPPSRVTALRVWDAGVPPVALLVGGIERPPRLAR